MKKGIKKIIAMVCAIVMVVSSMTINTKIEIKAADYSTLEFTKVEVAGLTGSYEYCITNNSMIGFSHLNFYVSGPTDYMQLVGSGDSKFNESTATVNGEDITKYHTWFDKAAAIYGVNVSELSDNAYYAYKVVSAGGTLEFVLKKGNPSGSEPIETTTATETSTLISPVTNVQATGGTKTITATWTNPTDAAAGTQYYVYLDDETTEKAVVETNSVTLTDIPAGNHIVKVKAFYNETFSTVAESPTVKVYGEPTAVTNLRVSSMVANQVTATWDNVADTIYTVELLNAENSVIDTKTVSDGTATCVFTDVAKGNYTVRVTATVNGQSATAVTSDSVTVNDLQPVKPTNLECTVDASRNVHITWNVENPAEGQYYKVYLDDTFKSDVAAGTFSYDMADVPAGVHTVKVVAVLGEYTTEAVTKSITIKADPITIYDTEIQQVTIGRVQTLDSTWSYEFDAVNSDSFIGLSSAGDLVAYIPSYAEAAVSHVYEQISGLEIGKIYTYTYRIDTHVAGNNLPVSVTADGGYSDTYELKEIPADGVEVTKTFTATAETMKIDYTLGWLNNKADIKISKAVVTMLQPVEVTGLVAAGGIKSINLSWESIDALENQTYNIYLDGSTTPIATDVKEKNYILSDVSVGTHSVTVKAVLNGIETSGQIIENVEVTEMPDYITSESVKVEGFQIKTNAPEDNVAFRTVCKAPNIGSSIVANDGNTYQVASMGTIYTLDVNNDGYRRNDVLDPLYTILNPTAVSAEVTEAKGYTYVGANPYNGAQRTYGYVATGKGIAANWNSADKDNTYYVRTMDGMSENGILEYSIHVRAFVVTTDGTIVYGKKTASVSVVEVADYLYKNSKAQNYSGHQYLYNSILNKVSNTNPYYRTSILSYGWDSSLFVPSSPTFVVNEGTLDDLNSSN